MFTASLDRTDEDAAFGGSNTIYGSVLSFSTYVRTQSMFGGRRGMIQAKRIWRHLDFVTMLTSRELWTRAAADRATGARQGERRGAM